MLRKGFTLIELLIVITIIAILAGAAIPYVQDYVEDARISRAKADLDEIRNALIRFELDRGVQYLATSTADLVGPYLDKAPIDPWGVPYCITATSSVVFSAGPNRDSGNSEFGGTAGTEDDDVARDFRPPLALSKAYWIDVNKDGKVSSGDSIKIRFTRPADATNLDGLDATDFAIKDNTGTLIGSHTIDAVAENVDDNTDSTKEATLDLTVVGTPFVPGRDTINVVADQLVDVGEAPYGPVTCSANLVLIQSF